MNGINRGFPLDLLSDGSKQTHLEDCVVDNMRQLIINAFAQNSIDISAVSYVVSPSVVRFEFTPSPGVKLSKIRSCEDDMNEALSNYGSVRLIAPVPGKGTIAVEVPRPDRQIVRLKEVLESKEFQDSKAHLPIALGFDSENNTIVADLAKMPHLLIAGATGQGKTTLLNSIILSLLYKLSPVDLKLVLIDPKMVEFDQFNTIKERYLLQTSDMAPVVFTDVEKVPAVLRSLVYEVQHRYDLLRISECRTIYEYNQKIAEGKLSQDQHHHLPYIIVVIDEFADLKITQERDFESPLLRIAQKSRAIGIHLVIATQRPSTDIITGAIKANFPARIAFKVCSEIDSKTILDINGAEKLLGMGDMLFMDNCLTNRIQGCFVDNEEIESVCDWIAKESPKNTSFVLPLISDPETFYKPISDGRDPLFEEVARIIVESQNASTSMLQRRYSIGYARACKIMDLLEAEGIVGPQNGGKPRKVSERDNEKKKSPFSFKHLLDFLKSDDDDEEDDDDSKDTVSIDAVMKEDDHKGEVSFAELLNLIDEEYSPCEYKLPYEDYIIIGDTAEIDKMCRSNGHINLDIPDFLSTLSKDTVNYVSTGRAEGPDCVVNALADALYKLPIEIEAISKLLFNVWTPNDMQFPMNEMKSMTDFIKVLPTDIDVVWGVAFDESMEGRQARVSLIAASK
ncbi:MAG: hypothetical protein K2K76_01300 [Muribaculaceae bacterium]|nr:hypothetical protein [Muribaculaceae bacterium]